MREFPTGGPTDMRLHSDRYNMTVSGPGHGMADVISFGAKLITVLSDRYDMTVAGRRWTTLR